GWKQARLAERARAIADQSRRVADALAARRRLRPPRLVFEWRPAVHGAVRGPRRDDESLAGCHSSLAWQAGLVRGGATEPPRATAAAGRSGAPAPRGGVAAPVKRTRARGAGCRLLVRASRVGRRGVGPLRRWRRRATLVFELALVELEEAQLDVMRLVERRGDA